MSFKTFEIIFDDPSACYESGQAVTGRVSLTVDAPIKIRGIILHFRGDSEVFWDIGNGVTDFTASETYFNHKLILVDEREEDTLLDGAYCFPFLMQLPQTLPTSFEGWDRLGHVRYTVRVTLTRQWKLPLECTAPFHVTSLLNLNLHPCAQDPVKLTQEKYFCCCCCKSGPLTLVVSLPVSGYVSGQVIPVTIEVDNISQQEVSDVTCKLKKVITFHARSPTPSSRQFNFTLHKLSLGCTVSGNGSKTWSLPFPLPALPPSNLLPCSLIDVDYCLVVEVKVTGLQHASLRATIPLTIGTVPLETLPSRLHNLEGMTCLDDINFI